MSHVGIIGPFGTPSLPKVGMADDTVLSHKKIKRLDKFLRKVSRKLETDAKHYLDVFETQRLFRRFSKAECDLAVTYIQRQRLKMLRSLPSFFDDPKIELVPARLEWDPNRARFVVR